MPSLVRRYISKPGEEAGNSQSLDGLGRGELLLESSPELKQGIVCIRLGQKCHPGKFRGVGKFFRATWLVRSQFLLCFCQLTPGGPEHLWLDFSFTYPLAPQEKKEDAKPV